MQVFRFDALHFEGAQSTRVEIDQRSRVSRRHLEQVEELLVPQIGPTRWFVTQALHWLHLGFQPLATVEVACPAHKWE
jgi:hypothetical protein